MNPKWEDGDVAIYLYEKKPLLEAKDTKLKVIQNDKEVEKICATVKDGYAVAEVEIQEKAEKSSVEEWTETPPAVPRKKWLSLGSAEVLAECSFTDIILTGSCFGDATSYPSVSHPNGDSLDLSYISRYSEQVDNQDQTLINAFDSWGFSQIITGSTQTWLQSDRQNRFHNDHLHVGNFISNLIAEINSNDI